MRKKISVETQGHPETITTAISKTRDLQRNLAFSLETIQRRFTQTPSMQSSAVSVAASHVFSVVKKAYYFL